MKLIQRIVLKYYKIKLRALEFVSPAKAAEAAFELFCTPYSRQKVKQIPQVFKAAIQLSFKLKNHKIQGYQWKPRNNNGHKILICHGFDSNSYKFERYISPLVNEGFEMLAFDAPAHGLSTGKTINALLYSEMIEEINAVYGPVDGIIAHSFGGIAATLMVERVKIHLVKRLVLIAPATETTRSLNDFCRYLQISDKLKQALENTIIQIGGMPSSWFSVARIIQSLTIPTLWLHDKQDRITPYEDMEPLTKLNLPCVEFIISDGLGHSLYKYDNIAEKIINFLSTLKINS